MRIAVPVVVLVGLAGLSFSQPPDNAKSTAAQKAIIELSENLDAADLPDRAARIVGEHESEHISSVFMQTRRGGMGVGKLAPSTLPHANSVDFLVRTWMRKPPTAAELEKDRDEMLKITRVIRAMSELAPYRVPKDARPAVKKEWAAVATEFHDTAAGLHTAVEKSDPAAIRDAARKLNNTCCHCHGLLD